MSDDVRLLRDRQFFVAAFQPNRAAYRANETCQRPEQRRLARTVGAGQHQRLTGRDRKRQAVDNAARPALYDQVFSNKLHREHSVGWARSNDGAFAHNAAATTWRVSLLLAII